jgi:hypothetical protein
MEFIMSNTLTTVFNEVVQEVVSEPMIFSALTQQAKSEANTPAVIEGFALDEMLARRIEGSVQLFKDSEDLFADAKSLINRAVSSVHTDLTEYGPPSFAFWMGYAEAWQKCYKLMTGCQEKRAQDAWYEVVRKLKEDFKLHRPEKATKDGKRMSSKRKAEKEKLEGMTDDVLRDNIKNAVAVGDFTQAKKLADEVKRRDKMANATGAELRKAEVEFIYKCMKMLTDDKLIAEIKALIPTSVIKAVQAKQ